MGTKHDKLKMEWEQNMICLNGLGIKHDKLKWSGTKRPMLQNHCYKTHNVTKSPQNQNKIIVRFVPTPFR